MEPNFSILIRELFAQECIKLLRLYTHPDSGWPTGFVDPIYAGHPCVKRVWDDNPKYMYRRIEALIGALIHAVCTELMDSKKAFEEFRNEVADLELPSYRKARSGDLTEIEKSQVDRYLGKI